MSSRLLWTTWFILYIVVAGIAKAETRKEVLVIDTGLPADQRYNKYLCDGLHYDVTGYGGVDVLGHGTNIIGIISKNLDTTKYCIRSIKWFHTVETSKNYVDLIKGYSELMTNMSPAFVNMSLAGSNYVINEFRAMQNLLNKGATVVVAAGNASKNLDETCDVFPSCYRFNTTKYRVVTSIRSRHPLQLHPFSNYGKVVTDYENGNYVCGFGICMTGTSQATAILTRKLINEEIN